MKLIKNNNAQHGQFMSESNVTVKGDDSEPIKGSRNETKSEKSQEGKSKQNMLNQCPREGRVRDLEGEVEGSTMLHEDTGSAV